MQDNVNSQNSKLSSVVDAADWLIEHNGDNPQFNANVEGKLSSVKAPTDELTNILTRRRIRLQEGLMCIEEFDAVVNRLFTEVQKLQSQFNGLLPVSVKWMILKHQIQEQKVF